MERESPKPSFRAFKYELLGKAEAQDAAHLMRSSGNFQGRILKLISVFCRWCNTSFCVCQCCWRGQAYCSDICRRAGYLRSRRQAQQRYRQTQKGKRAHCLSENRRRYRKTPPASKKMDDTTSKRSFNMHIRMSPEQHSANFHPDFRNRCHFCGRLGEIVPEFARRKYGNRNYGENFPTTMQEEHNETAIYRQ